MNWTRLHKSCPLCRAPTTLDAEKTISALQMDTIEGSDAVAIDPWVITLTTILKWMLLSVAMFGFNMFVMTKIISTHNYVALMGVFVVDMWVVGAVYLLWKKFHNQ